MNGYDYLRKENTWSPPKPHSLLSPPLEAVLCLETAGSPTVGVVSDWVTLGKADNLQKFTNLMGMWHKLNEITNPKEPGVKSGACWSIHLSLLPSCLEGSRENEEQDAGVGERSRQLLPQLGGCLSYGKQKDNTGASFPPVSLYWYNSRVLLAAREG